MWMALNGERQSLSCFDIVTRTSVISMRLWEQNIYPANFKILDERSTKLLFYCVIYRYEDDQEKISDLSGGLRRMFRPQQEEVAEREINYKHQTVTEKWEILILFSEEDMRIEEKDFMDGMRLSSCRVISGFLAFRNSTRTRRKRICWLLHIICSYNVSSLSIFFSWQLSNLLLNL